MKNEKQFLPIYELFKDHKADYSLKNVVEMYLPFWLCKQSIVVEKEVEIDRFSKILLQLIQNGINTHSEISSFLGVAEDSFIFSQISFLLKNGLITEHSSPYKYEITFEGMGFLERKKQIQQLEVREFPFYYNDLTKQLMPSNLIVTDEEETGEEGNELDNPQNKASSYKSMETKKMVKEAKKINHKNEPYQIDKTLFAPFFNQNHKQATFYDFEQKLEKAHQRSICFLVLEYEETETGNKTWDVRRCEKTVKNFTKNDYKLEEKLSEKVSQYLHKEQNTNPQSS